MSPEVVERFWTKVPDAGDEECWLWSGARTSSGYGSMSVADKTVLAHRLSVQISGRDVPKGAHVRHACDTPLCVNPAHLLLGTHAENMADMASRGRAVGRPSLSEDEARDVLRAEGSYDDIGRRFGISKWQVGRIKRGQSRARLQGADGEPR